MNEEQYKLYEMLRDAVLVIKDEKVTYLNSAAKRLFPKCSFGDSIIKYLPELAFIENKDDFSANIFVKGKSYNMAVRRVEDYSVYMIYVNNENEDDDINVELMRAICSNLQNSLAVVQMSTELLRPVLEEQKSKKVDGYTWALRHGYHNLLRTVGNVSKLYQAKSVTTSPKKEYFDLVKCCSELAESVAYLMADRKITVEFESLLLGSEYFFYGNEEQIEQMLLNLFSNSLKHTKEGGKVVLSLKVKHDRVYLSVKDNSGYIPADVMKNIFEMYKQPRSNLDDKTGIGLGFTVVQYIAKQHNGNVVLESKENEGTKVTIVMQETHTGEMVLRSRVIIPKPDKMRTVLIGLADVLSFESYQSKHID